MRKAIALKTLNLLFLLLMVAFVGCSHSTKPNNTASKPVQRASFPDNPCDLLNAAQVAEITGLEVTSANRVPSLDKVVEAQKQNRAPDPGTICSYETRSDFGAILIHVPARTKRNAAEYWAARAKYFETFPGAAQPLNGLGTDAWLSGGNALHVLIRGDEHFIVSTQMHQPRSRELLIEIARAVLARS